MTARPYVGTPGSATPTSTPAPTRSTDFTITAADIAVTLNLTIRDAEQLYSVGVNMINEYASRAPGANKDEALRRFLAYLDQAEPGAVQQETFGPKALTFTTNHSAAFRNSGAAMLLTHWKRRRAGAV